MCIRDSPYGYSRFSQSLISIAIDNLKISDITTDVITKFLDYLEIERKVDVYKRQALPCFFYGALPYSPPFFQAEDGIRDSPEWLEFRRVLFRSPSSLLPNFSSVSWWYCGWIAIRLPLTCIAEKVRSPWPVSYTHLLLGQQCHQLRLFNRL